MSDLFKKINTLVRAQIDGFIEDDLKLPRRRRHSDESFDPTGKDAAQAIADMRQQIENALSYEDSLVEQIDALHQEASDLDQQADAFLQNSKEDNARQTLEQLKRIERQITMLEADLARHRQQTAALMDRVNVMESMTGAAQAATGQATPPPAPTTDDAAINVPVTIVIESEQPQDAADSVPELPIQDESPSNQPTASDDDLAARRARLTQRPPEQQEE